MVLTAIQFVSGRFRGGHAECCAATGQGQCAQRPSWAERLDLKKYPKIMALCQTNTRLVQNFWYFGGPGRFLFLFLAAVSCISV